jgi:hypothetical protein
MKKVSYICISYLKYGDDRHLTGILNSIVDASMVRLETINLSQSKRRI